MLGLCVYFFKVVKMWKVCKWKTVLVFSVTHYFFLPSNRAYNIIIVPIIKNIITLKTKVLHPNSSYKHVASLCYWKLFSNQKQFINQTRFICVVTRNEVIMNPLEDLLALNICAQNFSVSEIIMEGFKIDQSTINYDPWQRYFNR